MSFNYENIGNPIAKIIGKNNNKTIYLNENSDDIDKPFKELQLSNNNMFQQCKIKHEQIVYKHCIHRNHNLIILFGSKRS